MRFRRAVFRKLGAFLSAGLPEACRLRVASPMLGVLLAGHLQLVVFLPAGLLLLRGR